MDFKRVKQVLNGRLQLYPTNLITKQVETRQMGSDTKPELNPFNKWIKLCSPSYKIMPYLNKLTHIDSKSLWQVRLYIVTSIQFQCQTFLSKSQRCYLKTFCPPKINYTCSYFCSLHNTIFFILGCLLKVVPNICMHTHVIYQTKPKLGLRMIFVSKYPAKKAKFYGLKSWVWWAILGVFVMKIKQGNFISYMILDFLHYGHCCLFSLHLTLLELLSLKTINYSNVSI